MGHPLGTVLNGKKRTLSLADGPGWGLCFLRRSGWEGGRRCEPTSKNPSVACCKETEGSLSGQGVGVKWGGGIAGVAVSGLGVGREAAGGAGEGGHRVA